MIAIWLEEYLSGFAANRVLDIGPGYSNFGRIAAHITGANQITYVDNNRSVLEWQASESQRAGMEAVCIDAILDDAGLTRLEGVYDLILCQEVLEHLHHAEQVLVFLAKHLADHGRIVVTVPTQRSERWLKWLNPSYMRNEPFGHVREFSESALRNLFLNAGLEPLVLFPTQPHYFLGHTWFFGTRMKVEGATGKPLSQDYRMVVFDKIVSISRRFFLATNPRWWGYLLPRNYFAIAVKRSL